MDVAKGDITWNAASMAQSFRTGEGTCGKSEFDVERKDMSEEPVRQSRVCTSGIARRNPPVTDDHNLSNPSERYRTRLDHHEQGPSMTPFKHMDASLTLCNALKKVHESLAFGGKQGNISLVTRL